MAISMYDLAAADQQVRFSPYCWRVKMALAHKGLEADYIPWHFTDKAALAFAEHDRVPVLRDGDTTVVDSWQILQYLDRTYPEQPVFYPDPAAAQFFKSWSERTVLALVFQCIVADIHDGLREADKDYFRQTREARLGATLEAVQGRREQTRRALVEALEPLRATLERQPYVCGERPSASDYLLFGCFQFARSVSAFQLLPADSAVYCWRERLLDLHGGVGRRAPGHELSGAEL